MKIKKVEYRIEIPSLDVAVNEKDEQINDIEARLNEELRLLKATWKIYSKQQQALIHSRIEVKLAMPI
ncbi:hypothetical protein LQZ18_00480 [Lachnospiraceae bacterium ZAX-1]